MEQETGTLMVMTSMMSVDIGGPEGNIMSAAKTFGVVRDIIDAHVKNNKTADKHTPILRYLCMTIIIIL